MPEESYSSSSPNGFWLLDSVPEMVGIKSVAESLPFPSLPLPGALLARGLDANGFPSPRLSPLSGLPNGLEGDPKGFAA